MKAGTELEPIAVADFRIESLQLDKLMRSLQNYFNTFPLPARMTVVSRWEALKKTLESLPNKRDGMPRMDLLTLPIQTTPEDEQYDDDDDIEPNHPQITGDFHEESIDEGDLEQEISIDMDVCVYTRTKIGRPWVGRVLKITSKEEFEIQWYEKDGNFRNGTYKAMKLDNGSPYVSEQRLESVMFWSFAESRSDISFVISPYWQACLKREYVKLDSE